MSITDSIRNIFRRSHNHGAKDVALPGARFYNHSFPKNMAMKLSTVYRCIDSICSAVAQLPLELYSIDSNGYRTKLRTHYLYGLLNRRPNARMTRYTFLSLMIASMHLRGNAYAYILRENKKISQLVYLPAESVQPVLPNFLDKPVGYKVNGIPGIVPAKDMIHLVNMSEDGVTGISTLSYAAHTLGLSYNAEKHASKFFSSGCGVGGVLKSSQFLSKEQKEALKKDWNEVVQSNDFSGVAILGADLDFRAMTVNPADAQLLESRQFNVVDICRFFGVNPVKAFDLTHSSYSTVEATNLSFLTDTISPLLEKIEQELECKLFGENTSLDVLFDVSRLLRADKQSQAQYYARLFQLGAMSPNEIRREIDLPAIEGGDDHYVQVNLAPIGNDPLKNVNEN